MTDQLLEILTYRRPAFSTSERKMIRRHIAPIGAKADLFGNYVLRIGSAPILWSSHTDTVHTTGGRQDIRVVNGTVSLNDPSSSCLGADDGVGVWLMLEMARAGVEGLYVFHRSEESGAKGAHFIAKYRSTLLKDIQFAIAFDRYGTTEVITHQCGCRTASDAFALSFSDAIKMAGGPKLEASEEGVFTDTQIYASLIAECTNIAVGYRGHHTKSETLDLDFAVRLRDALVSADFSRLVCARDPSKVEYAPTRGYGSYFRQRYGYYSAGELDQEEERDAVPHKSGGRNPFDALLTTIKQHPEATADLLDQWGITADDIYSAVYNDTRTG